MKVSINARNIKNLVNADVAHVNSAEPAPPASPATTPPHPPELPAAPSRGALPPEFTAEVQVLEQLAQIDVGGALNKVRYLTEKVLHTLSMRHGVSWGQAEPTLERMIGPLLSANVIPKNIAIHVRTIQTNASPGSHYQESPLSSPHLLIARAALTELLGWFADAAPTEREG